jgi:hypothetical protein
MDIASPNRSNPDMIDHGANGFARQDMQVF